MTIHTRLNTGLTSFSQNWSNK